MLAGRAGEYDLAYASQNNPAFFDSPIERAGILAALKTRDCKNEPFLEDGFLRSQDTKNLFGVEIEVKLTDPNRENPESSFHSPAY